MKIVFAGTPEFALAPLKTLIEEGREVVGVLTQEDKPQGRKGILTPSPVKRYALENGLPVFTPKKLKDETAGLAAFGGDVLVTCAYGQILTQPVLDLFSKGVWNIHAGLLPAYRGASPIQSCILAGEKETGVCLMKTELGLDTGDVLLCEKTMIGENETYGELSDRLSLLGARVLSCGLPLIENGTYKLTPQGEEGVRVCKKILNDAGKIDFSLSAEKIENTVRAFNPEPVAFSFLNGARVNLFRVKKVPLPQGAAEAAFGEIVSEKPKQGLIVRCGDGAIELVELQPSGGKKMGGGDFLNGRKGGKGQVFSC